MANENVSYFCCCLVAMLCLTLTIPWTVALRASLSMGFPRQEYLRALSLPSPGDLSHPGIKPASHVLAGIFFTTKSPGKLCLIHICPQCSMLFGS